jgi:hypothetical protein
VRQHRALLDDRFAAIAAVYCFARLQLKRNSAPAARFRSDPKIYTRSPGLDERHTSDGILFAGFLLAVIVIVGGLTYLPALALGPVIEHLQLPDRILY